MGKKERKLEDMKDLDELLNLYDFHTDIARTILEQIRKILEKQNAKEN